MAFTDNLKNIAPQLSEIKTGTPMIKVGDDYIVGGIGGNFIPGGQVVVNTEFYKCASVDTVNHAWTGYKAVLNSQGYYEFEDTVTTGLTYIDIIPIVDTIYSSNALVTVSKLYQGIPPIPTENLWYYLPLYNNYNASVGSTTTLENGTISFGVDDSIHCAIFNGTQNLKNTNLWNSTSNFSVSFWAKANNDMEYSAGCIIAPCNNTYIEVGPTKITVLADEGSEESVNNITGNKWHNYIITETYSTMMWNLYVDGINMYSGSLKNPNLNNGKGYIRIGCHGYNGSYRRYSGKLAALRIYTSIISEDDILALSKEFTPTNS